MPRINQKTAYEREKSPLWFSRSSADPLASWRISGIKGPVFEQWYFDSVSNDGKSSICMIFARDASYALLGHGHLRMEFDIILPDGTHINHANWMSEALLEDYSTETEGENSGQIVGKWTGEGMNYSFRIAADGSKAMVDLQGPNIQGSFTLTSSTPPHYPGGKTHAEAGKDASTELCPKINLVEVIPVGDMVGELTCDGRPLKFGGIGGHMHVWAEASWFDSVLGWRMCRGSAGPWAFTTMQWQSMKDGLCYTSGYVCHSGRKEFGALEITESKDGQGDTSSGKGVVQWQPVENVGTAGPFADRSSGCVLRYRSKYSNEEIRFQLAHQKVAFSVNFGGGESGLTGFLSQVTGGKAGEEESTGHAFVNVCVLPQGLTKVYFFLCMILTKLTFGYINILGINT